MANEEPNEPKLIIDEDWKAQVQREKEQAAKSRGSDSEGAPDASAGASAGSPSAATERIATAQNAGDSAATEASSGGTRPEDLPPATFDLLITMLGTQAMVALGHLPDASGKPGPKDKPLAKHYIDLLGVLEEKTQGNLEPTEKKMLGEVLHSLRMTFVHS